MAKELSTIWCSSLYNWFPTDEEFSCFVDLNDDTSLACDHLSMFILFSDRMVPHCVGLPKATPKVLILGKENNAVL